MVVGLAFIVLMMASTTVVTGACAPINAPSPNARRQTIGTADIEQPAMCRPRGHRIVETTTKPVLAVRRAGPGCLSHMFGCPHLESRRARTTASLLAR